MSTRKKTITEDRAKISLLLSQIDELVCQIDESRARSGLNEAGTDVINHLFAALGDAREMIGDTFEDVDGRAVWHIAAQPTMTWEQLRAEFVNRGLSARRAS